ncbi:hypothetical protein [Aquiflexum sp.]|uniref:hypothetical protein n=1 Tax=Aquiflexum sp. TaxID=1872584 RepID=UPI0035938A59
MNFKPTFNLLLIFALFLLGSCDENAEPTILSQELEGTYSGTFQRFSGETAGEIALVELNFENGNWEGTSSIQKYPALCNGTYKIENQKITFTNSCFWTAEFDWTLILSGTYVLEQSQNTLKFERILGTGENQIRDVYVFEIAP